MKTRIIAALVGVLVTGLASSAQTCEQAQYPKPTHTTSAPNTGKSASKPSISDCSALTVFIDGPTGFVFVWTTEGWKFVQKIEEGKLLSDARKCDSSYG